MGVDKVREMAERLLEISGRDSIFVMDRLNSRIHAEKCNETLSDLKRRSRAYVA